MHTAMSGTFIFILILINAIRPSNGKPGKFEDELLTLMDEILGSSAFKSYLKQGNMFRSDSLDSDKMVKHLAKNIEEKIISREIAIRKLKKVVTESLDNSLWGLYPECCRYSDYDLNLVYDHRFFGKVDVNALCTMQSSMATKKNEVPDVEFLVAAKENLRDFPGIKAQYFGSDGGILLSFPVSTVPSCGNYDNRFRPWYVQASAPVPKDIVIVMDMSGSMKEENRLQAAIHAATTILETLSPDDRVTVIGFSDYAFAVGSDKADAAISSRTYGGFRGRDEEEVTCFDVTMSKATPRNVHLLSAAVAKMVPHGETNYTTGLKMAFDFLYGALKRDVTEACGEGTPSATEIAYTRHRVIIFLSDGEPSDRPAMIRSLIYHRNREMHNSVVLLCYALGEGTFGHFLRLMSEQQYVPNGQKTCLSETAARCEVNGSLLCKPPPTRFGHFQQVTDSQYLRSSMGSYYNYFATEAAKVASFMKLENSDNIVWSVPYFDAGGLGMVVTAASSVVLKNRLVGVVGTDLTAREMIKDIVHFHAGGQDSYAFVMDNTGHVLLHPYMPSPSAVTQDPVLSDIGAFERTPKVKKFLADILSQTKVFGSQPVEGAKVHQLSVKTKIALPQEHRNVEARDADLTYSCIAVRHLVVCVVVDGMLAGRTKFNSLDLPPNFNFLYHRFDISPPTGVCEYQREVSSGTKSAVMLAPSAFLDIGLQLGQPETWQFINELEQYFEDPSNYYQGTTPEEVARGVNLRPGIRDDVRATFRLEELWNSQMPGRISAGGYISRETLRRSVIYRYFSTGNGVFRIHPGVQVPKSYNPLHRPWYEQARSLLYQELANSKECATMTSKCGDVASVSPPYLDASGAGVVVTISQAIVAPKAAGAEPWHIVGVMGGDIKLAFLDAMLTSSVVECDKYSTNDCILIDLAGYVIYDKALAAMDDTMIEKLVQTNYHLTYAHRVLAEVLVKNKILVRQKCTDVSKVAYAEEYRVDLPRLAKRGKTLPFKTFRINSTNIVLLIVSKDLWMPQYINEKICILHELNSVTCERPVGSDQCESPCVNTKDAKLDHGQCTNTFNLTWEHHPPPCVPDKFIDERLGPLVEASSSADETVVEVGSMETCFEQNDIGELVTEKVGTASFSLRFVVLVAALMVGKHWVGGIIARNPRIL